MFKVKFTVPFLMVLLLPLTTSAAPEDFSKGPIFKNYGENTAVQGGLVSPKHQRFKVVFDISDQAQGGTTNRNFNSVARFINMHVRAGVPKANIEVAMIVHGKASNDLMSDKAYSNKFNQTNPSSELVNLLAGSGVTIYLCGQSASYHSIRRADLNQNVALSLSAMTINALLQQQGYTLNPF
jgi:intracellular sulfur oxidation DsrE/DsrF family protein